MYIGKQNPKYILIFGVISIGVGLVLAVIQVHNRIVWRNARHWAEVPAHIRSAALDIRPDFWQVNNDDDREKRVNIKVIAEYDYEYEGRKYTSHNVHPFYGNDNSFSQNACRTLLEHQQSGKPFLCYVNPARPEQAFLYRDLDWLKMESVLLSPWLFGLIGLILVVAARIDLASLKRGY